MKELYSICIILTLFIVGCTSPKSDKQSSPEIQPPGNQIERPAIEPTTNDNYPINTTIRPSTPPTQELSLPPQEPKKDLIEQMLTYGKYQQGPHCASDKECDDSLIFTKDVCLVKNYYAYSSCKYTNVFGCPNSNICQQISDISKRDQCFYKNRAYLGQNDDGVYGHTATYLSGGCCIAIEDEQLQKQCMRDILDAPITTDREYAYFMGMGCGMIKDDALKAECYQKELHNLLEFNAPHKTCYDLSPGNDINSCAIARKECDLIQDPNSKDDCLLQK